MIMNKINLDLVFGFCTGGKAFSTKAVLFMLFAMALMLPAMVQADGLFDFQMKLAEKGNAEAEFKVGEMYETGFGVKKDMKQAESWITKAANQGHETAAFKLLYWDMEKNGVTAANKDKVEALKAKAKTGDPQAQYYFGRMYANGVGVKKNPDKAISWLNKAALVGVLQAESEIVFVREEKQRQILAKRRADEKRRAQLKAKQESERKARLEEQRKQQALKEAQAKARAEEALKKNKAAMDARSQAEKIAAEKEAQKAKFLAQKKAIEAEQKRLEAQKQALLKKRAADDESRKAKFESDPCSGKSARFLSTCK